MEARRSRAIAPGTSMPAQEAQALLKDVFSEMTQKKYFLWEKISFLRCFLRSASRFDSKRCCSVLCYSRYSDSRSYDADEATVGSYAVYCIVWKWRNADVIRLNLANKIYNLFPKLNIFFWPFHLMVPWIGPCLGTEHIQLSVLRFPFHMPYFVTTTHFRCVWLVFYWASSSK